jgi:hypothetical protein
MDMDRYRDRLKPENRYRYSNKYKCRDRYKDRLGCILSMDLGRQLDKL